MSLEQFKTSFQVMTYFGMALTIFGSFLLSLYPNIKLKLLFNSPIGASIIFLGGIIFLIGNIYTDKINQQKQIDFDKQLLERDNIIKKNAEKSLLTNRFYAELDNPIKSMFFVLDLGSTLLSDNFRGFTCVIRFDLLDITVQFKTIQYENTLSENTQYIEMRMVKGKDLEDSPILSVGSGSFKNMSEIYLDLMMITRLLPEGASIRDLSEQTFYFYLSEKQTSLVKGIKLNVNNWDIFKKTENRIHWRELKQDWLPEKQGLKVFYQEYQTQFYDNNKILFFQEGFSYYEIVRSNVDSRSMISIEEVEQMLNDVNVEEGSIMIDIDNKWRTKNDAYIRYLPLTTKDGFSISIYRDSDNLLKVHLSYKYSKNIILKVKHPENYIDSKSKHRLLITWSEKSAILYIDGNVVDEFIVN